MTTALETDARALTWRDELRATLRLAVPVIAIEVGLMLMGSVDTMFVGRVSGTALAAVAMGHAYLWVVAILGIGILMALDPLVSQAQGAGDEVALARGIQRAFVLVLPLAARFARASIPGLLPLYAFIVLRLALQAKHRLAPVVTAIVVANVVNVALNYLLVFGKFGAPNL